MRELNENEKEKYYDEIKKLIIEDEAYQEVKDYSKNRHELITKYNIGKTIIEMQGGEVRSKYGSSLIKEFAKRLIEEIGKKYDYTTLKRCRQFYLFSEKVATLSRQSLSFSHYVEIMTLKDECKIKYYIRITESQKLSVRHLRERIKSKEYERLPESMKKKLASDEEKEIALPDTIKDPIILYTNKNYETFTHKVLEEIIMDDLTNFLLRLGEGYLFVGKEYQIKIGNRYHYIDLLLYNIKYNAYVVVELKTTEITERDYGQIKGYMNYIDENIKQFNQNNTYGIIICKKYDEWIIRYIKDNNVTIIKFEIKEGAKI